MSKRVTQTKTFNGRVFNTWVFQGVPAAGISTSRRLELIGTSQFRRLMVGTSQERGLLSGTAQTREAMVGSNG